MHTVMSLATDLYLSLWFLFSGLTTVFFIQMLIIVCLYHSLGYTLSTSWIGKLYIKCCPHQCGWLKAWFPSRCALFQAAKHQDYILFFSCFCVSLCLIIVFIFYFLPCYVPVWLKLLNKFDNFTAESALISTKTIQTKFVLLLGMACNRL